ncbi:MAG: hypothetical protein ACI97K_001738 [Glaciecola sp.]|jgi:hypothetical protein
MHQFSNANNHRYGAIFVTIYIQQRFLCQANSHSLHLMENAYCGPDFSVQTTSSTIASSQVVLLTSGLARNEHGASKKQKSMGAIITVTFTPICLVVNSNN